MLVEDSGLAAHRRMPRVGTVGERFQVSLQLQFNHDDFGIHLLHSILHESILERHLNM
jgi:hypothetical protein